MHFDASVRHNILLYKNRQLLSQHSDLIRAVSMPLRLRLLSVTVFRATRSWKDTLQERGRMRTVSARCLYGCCGTPQRNILALSWYMAVLFRQYTENICLFSKFSAGGLCDWGILLVISLAVFKFVVDTRFQLERKSSLEIIWRSRNNSSKLDFM